MRVRWRAGEEGTALVRVWDRTLVNREGAEVEVEAEVPDGVVGDEELDTQDPVEVRRVLRRATEVVVRIRPGRDA